MMRTSLRHLAIFSLSVAALVGCNEHPLTPLGDTLVSVQIETSPRLGSNAVDILWVVDDSPSMREEQVELGARFDEFITALADLQADFHMGVITTDRNDGGLFQTEPGPLQSLRCEATPPELEYCENLRFEQPFLQGGDYLVDVDDPSQGFETGQLSQDFRCIASAGDCGGAFERGLETLELALGEDLGPANSGFLRDDAFLVIIFLTDEDDCSNNDAFSITQDNDCYAIETRDSLVPVQNYYDNLVALKGGDESRVLIAGLIGPSDNLELQTYEELAQNGPRFSCISQLQEGAGAANARDGERYRELIDLVGSRGIEESICQGDFSRALNNIGEILRENLDVNCLREAPRTCELDSDCGASGATCMGAGELGGDLFCSNFELAVEIQDPEGGPFAELLPPGPVGQVEPNADAEFLVDYDAQACLHGVSFSFAPGSRPATGSRYRLSYPRSIEIIEAGVDEPAEEAPLGE